MVADRELTRSTLAAVLSEYPEFVLLGVDSGDEVNSELLANGDLQLLVVNLPIEYHHGRSQAIEYVRHVKQRRPDVRILLLKRRSEEYLVRASLEAGADGCCLQAIAAPRLALAIKAVADGAAWLDPEIAEMILHGHASYLPASRQSDDSRVIYHLSPRERQILTHLSEGESNDEIAGALHCSLATVKTHLGRIFTKLGVNDRVSAVVTALRFGLILTQHGPVEMEETAAEEA